MRRLVKVVGITVVTVGAASIVATLIVRDSISRHRRDLFSSRPLRRLAALGYIAGQPASVDLVLLLRDFITGEPKKLIRDRARAILQRMEAEVSGIRELPAGASG